MSATARAGRAKLSTTVDSANFQFLETMVRTGQVHSIADAVDRAVRLLRRTERRSRLERDTAAYFNGLAENAAHEEDALAEALHTSARGLDYDLEP
jgi:Arc/MetJ-type ribon-helix-helix transcriptional regulator